MSYKSKSFIKQIPNASSPHVSPATHYYNNIPVWFTYEELNSSQIMGMNITGNNKTCIPREKTEIINLGVC